MAGRHLVQPGSVRVARSADRAFGRQFREVTRLRGRIPSDARIDRRYSVNKRPGVRVQWCAQQDIGRSLLENAALPHYQHPVSETPHARHVMGDHKVTGSELVLQLTERVEQPGPHRLIEARGRFVEHDDVRRRDQRTGDRHPAGPARQTGRGDDVS